MRRVLPAIALAILLAAASAGLWAWWASNEYRGLDYCPYDVPGHGHPVLVAVGVMVGAAVIAFVPKWGKHGRHSLAFSVATALLAGAAIFVVALFVGGGLRCMD